MSVNRIEREKFGNKREINLVVLFSGKIERKEERKKERKIDRKKEREKERKE